MREGWAKRFFVLSKDTLFYFLIPKLDMQGNLPLLGEERGQIKLSDVQDVMTTAADSECWYITITVSQLKKNSASGYLSTPVSQLFLRAPKASGQLWASAILNARDSIRSGTSPSASFRQLKSWQSKDLAGGFDSKSDRSVAAVAPFTMPVLTAGELRPVDEILPLATGTPASYLLGALVLLNAVLFGLGAVPSVIVGANITAILWYADIRRREYNENSVGKVCPYCTI